MSTKTYCSTDPRTGATKRVAPSPPKAAGETPAQRLTRLMSQAAANRLRVRQVDDWTWQVPSQRKAADGTRAAHYLVRQYPGLGWSCTCEWQQRHELYCDENPLACCAHIAQVIKHVERDAREIARLAARMVARLATQQADPVPYVPETGPLAAHYRQDLAAAALRELYGEEAA